MVVRDMAKYGDQFEQVGLHKKENGSLGLARLVNMPVKTMWVKQQTDGSVDPADTYAQILPTLHNKLVASWPWWKLVQFSNRKSRADLYGRSIFESSLRAYIQLEAMEAAMVSPSLRKEMPPSLTTSQVFVKGKSRQQGEALSGGRANAQLTFRTTQKGRRDGKESNSPPPPSTSTQPLPRPWK